MPTIKKLNTIKLDPEIVALMEAEIGRRRGSIKWTKEMDKLILTYWPKISHRAFVKIFIHKYKLGSRDSIRDRYALLKECLDGRRR